MNNKEINSQISDIVKSTENHFHNMLLAGYDERIILAGWINYLAIFYAAGNEKDEKNLHKISNIFLSMMLIARKGIIDKELKINNVRDIKKYANKIIKDFLNSRKTEEKRKKES